MLVARDDKNLHAEQMALKVDEKQERVTQLEVIE